MDKTITVRLTPEQESILDSICASTGWTQSQVIRMLLDRATIRPAVIHVVTPEPKEIDHVAGIQ